jgi:hypothetical protein
MTKKNRGKWTTNEEKKLVGLFKQGLKVKQIARVLGRTFAATNTRLSYLRKSGALDEKRGASNGPVTPATGERGPNDTQPTGEDALPTAIQKRDMVSISSEELRSLRDAVKQLKKKNSEGRARNIVANRRIKTLENALDFAEKKMDQGFAAQEFTQQLQRENAALRKALAALNEVILVYTARGEDSA